MKRVTTAIRLSEELKIQLETQAELNHRSLNSEMVFRLEASLKNEMAGTGADNTLPTVTGDSPHAHSTPIIRNSSISEEI